MIRLSKSSTDIEEINAVIEVLSEGFLGMGSFVNKFEMDLGIFFNRKVSCVNTGTSAIQLALQAIGIKRGDEVLVQSLTYVATFQAISALGAHPVSCDINPETLTICLKDAASKINTNTKAIIPVHYAGSPGNLDEIYNFANNNKLRVIEDAAHAFGTTYKNKLIGSFGDISCFSFDGIKNITSGEGGAVVTSDINVIEKINDIRLLGVVKDTENRFLNKRSWDFDVIDQGWRYHMSNIMASIGIIQLKKFNNFKIKRQNYAKHYTNKLMTINKIKLHKINFDEVVPHIYIIQVSNNERDKLREYLDIFQIQTGIHYKPNHLLTYYKGSSKLNHTEKVYNEILTLPLHPELNISDIDFICSKIHDFFIQK